LFFRSEKKTTLVVVFEMYESSDSDDDELMPKAFAVDGEMSPDEGPPTNGEDYLRRVRFVWKRKKREKLSVKSN
jgi:hypothetical protein